MRRLHLAACVALGLSSLKLSAHENYEVHVYPSKTADPHTTLFELHSKQVQSKVALGTEYDGTTGSLAQIAPSAEQSHILYPSIDLFLSPDWEFTAGYGVKLSGVGEE